MFQMGGPGHSTSDHGDAATGRARTILTESDEAWVDVDDDFRWLAEGRRFTWVSERDGWRHVYTFGRSGESMTLLTPGRSDVIQLQEVDGLGQPVGARGVRSRGGADAPAEPGHGVGDVGVVRGDHHFLGAAFRGPLRHPRDHGLAGDVGER